MSHDNNPAIIAVDDDDSRSDVGSSLASSTVSIRSSLLRNREENGRTYHRYKDGQYNLPNDERENDRLDLQHQLYLLTLDDRLGIAPPAQEDAKVGRVLDIGTGTGIWAIHYGDDHPEADIIGVDLSPSQPQNVPPNIRFEIDDVEEEWNYSQGFEYIHSRFMTSSISDWKKFLQQCYANLEPGGYVELQEGDLFPLSDDGTLTRDHALNKWCRLLLEASEKFGRPYMEVPKLKELMVEVGFTDVSMSLYKWPSNAWPKETKYKELGIWNGENMAAGLEAFSMAPFTRAHGWTKAEVDVFLVDVRKDMKNRAIHAYWPIYCIIGRKPEESETPGIAAP
ncbi:methyltransferase domain-containing protein [Colletotrichum plurivorum]|uniref:Methyltransferase domain-containing protein n=1 Tax=Colletotrichum plurivorum TaxID=2175906 RepID=A0A8H6JNN5_9PEZI|nr:methyltransferase domain-containing protein [Colletotrichum plurivorum]